MSSTAIVIGGGMAGMASAAVLAEAVDHVVLIERDIYPEGIGDRRGVPQGRMFHTLLERGRREIEEIFPGFHRLLDERGMPKVAFGFNCALMTHRGWQQNLPVPVQRMLFCSRGFLESAMRDLFVDNPWIETLQGTAVIGLQTQSDGAATRCAGVRVRERETGEERELLADLILDASGANTRAPQWLRDAGIEPPREYTLDPLLTYGGRRYRMKPGAKFPKHWWWTHGAMIQRVPPDDNKAAHLIRHEQGMWLLTLVAGDGHSIPKTDEGIADFLARMRSPIVSDLLPYFEPIDDMTSFRLPKNSWKFYEKWDADLHGFLAIGASTCVFNPNQGQGMSVAVGDAAILRDCLKTTTDPEELPKLFFRRQVSFQKNAFRLAVANDLRFRAVEGRRGPAIRFGNWYREQLTRAGSADRYVARRLGEVNLLLKPVSTLYRPAVVTRLLFARLCLFWKQDPTVAERVAPIPPPPAKITRSWRSRLRQRTAIVARSVRHRIGLAS